MPNTPTPAPETIDEISKNERSLLLFLETCAVDNTGLIDARRMSDDDFAIAKRWAEIGFIKFGRIVFADVERFSKPYSQWCELSDEAFTLAHEERRARAARMLKKRDWTRTEEK